MSQAREVWEYSPAYGPMFGYLGAMAAITMTGLGAAYGSAKCMMGIAMIAPKRPKLIVKAYAPVVMASVIAIYGLVVAVMITQKIEKPPAYTLYKGFSHFSGGLAVGFCGLASGMCVGVLGDWGVRSSALRMPMYMSTLLMTGFAMVLGMYGLIVALMQCTK